VKKWTRKIRGAIGLGLAWAFAWFAAGMVLLLIVGTDAADVPFPLFFGLLGFLSGVSFAGVLGLVDGRRRFDQMSMPRFAAWGGLGSVLLAGVFSAITGQGLEAFALLGPIFGVAGATCAAGSLGLARMAQDGALVEAGSEVDDAGLTSQEKEELLGGRS
jgi:hypothetical protein